MNLTANGQGDGAASGTITQRYHWDGNSRLDTLFDDKSNATVYQFDELDRAIKEVAPDFTFKKTDYDRDDNPITTTDANGTVVTRAFDVLNRLTGVSVAK